jgi:hypothetical protein
MHLHLKSRSRGPKVVEPEILCTELLTRVLRNKNNVDENGNITAEAFLLREKDAGKLSVYRQEKVSPDACIATFKKTYGAASLHTGHVRSINEAHPIGIDVIPAESVNDLCPGHSAIINLPDQHASAKPEEAERMASILRDQARKLR